MNTFESQYYESSEFWSHGAVADPANLARIDATIGLIPPGVRSLVDVGCGNGVFLNRLQASGRIPILLGIDRSQEALSYVKARSLVGDIAATGLGDCSHDCVCCLQVLEHLPMPVYDIACSEIARIARKFIVIGVPFQERIESNVTTCPQCRSTFNIDLHLRSFCDETLRRLFEREGFELIRKIDPVPRVVHLLSALMRRVLGVLNRPRQDLNFRSPLCPVCGWRNEGFRIEHRLTEKSRPNALSAMLSSVGPKVVRPGYWIVALYERRSASSSVQ